jgi:hypothetical protein
MMRSDCRAPAFAAEAVTVSKSLRFFISPKWTTRLKSFPARRIGGSTFALLSLL